MQRLHLVDASELASAYAAADYAVVLDGDTLSLRVGQPAVDVEAYWAARQYAFITAWNPASHPLPQVANDAADARLVARLQALDLSFHPAWSDDRGRQWRESGWLVADIDVSVLDTLAVEFGQAGTLFWEHGAPVRLRMSMQAPAQRHRSDCIDWGCGIASDAD